MHADVSFWSNLRSGSRLVGLPALRDWLLAHHSAHPLYVFWYWTCSCLATGTARLPNWCGSGRCWCSRGRYRRSRGRYRLSIVVDCNDGSDCAGGRSMRVRLRTSPGVWIMVSVVRTLRTLCRLCSVHGRIPISQIDADFTLGFFLTRRFQDFQFLLCVIVGGRSRRLRRPGLIAWCLSAGMVVVVAWN